MSEQGVKNVSGILDVVSKRDGLLWLLVYVSLGLGGGSSFLVASNRASPETDHELAATRREVQTIAIEIGNIKADLRELTAAHYKLERNVPPPEVRNALSDLESRMRMVEREVERGNKK